MAIDKEVKDYIDSLMNDLKVKGSIANGTRKEGSDTGENSLISGINNEASGPYSAAIGSNNEAKGHSSVVFGEGNKAYSNYQLVHGKFNDLDSNNIYAHIIGGGTYDTPKNIYTLDWEGNATFAGAISTEKAPSNGNDLVNLDYLNQNIPIKFFPYHEVDETTVKIYANDLDPYTIYKVKTDDKYNRIQFYVKVPGFGDVPFLTSDSTMNKYNMFVADKTEDEMTFIVNSEIYHIDLKTGRITKEIDGSFSGPDFDEEGNVNINFAEIDDEGNPNPNKVWSSYKITQELANSFTAARIQTIDDKPYLILTRYNEEEVELELPFESGLDFSVIEDIILRVDEKITRPDGGEEGQILTLDSNGNPVWTDPVYKTDETPPSAEDIQYSRGDIDNVADALDELFYTVPEITKLTASKADGLYEKGEVIRFPIYFSWDFTYSEPLESLQFSYADSLTTSSKGTAYTIDNIKDDMDFTLTIKDTRGNTASKTISYKFDYAMYYGVSAEPPTYNPSFILSLNKQIGKLDNYTADLKEGQFMYLCIPIKWGIVPTLSIDGIIGGFEKVTEVLVNCKSGTINYIVLRSINHSLKNINLSIDWNTQLTTLDGIPLSSNITQKGNGTYWLVDSNAIYGGLYHVYSLPEMEALPESNLKQGMLCYVGNNDKYYKYKDNQWTECFFFESSEIEDNIIDEQETQELINIFKDDTV